jgi:two-component system nitrogen regulation response regulator GlnG
LDGTTRKKPPLGAQRRRTRNVCLTICSHPDLTRVGARARLAALRIRKPVEVSRLAPLFEDSEGSAAPLHDPYVSRTPLRIAGDPAAGLDLHYDRDDLRIDGRAVQGAFHASPDDVERGLVIELAERVVLLLHLHEGGSSAELEGLFGQSDAMARVRDDVLRVASSNVAVLLQGETGAGKELVARAIHAHSERRDKPLLAVNLAALPSSTAASALFGHARGAFTGATDRHIGLFERAHGGTLFLDEIGEAPDDVQPMLLRVLETGELTPLGAGREVRVDVRVISATDADLERDLERGAFRRALYHRLAGFQLRVPPLRERRDDIGPLFLRFLQQELQASGDRSWLEPVGPDDAPRISPAIVPRLLLHPLDGNVRQLRNIVQRLVLLNRGRPQLELDPELERSLALELTDAEPRAGDAPSAIGDDRLLRALEEQRWSPRRAAAALGVPISTLYDLMRRSGSVRKAKDLAPDELERALQAAGGDVEQAASELRVSERGLRIVLRERGLLS